jgi:hypothetical protein
LQIQTESPYYLPDPQAPEPFTNITRFAGDPDFKDCDASKPHCAAAWGLSIISSTNVRVYGAGLYNWFQRYVQPCVDTQDCQQRVVNIKNSGQVWIYNLYTIGTVEMINHGDDKPVLAKSNTNTNGHPFTSVVNAWLLASTGEYVYLDELFLSHTLANWHFPRGSREDDGDLDDDEDYGTLANCNGLYDSLEQIQDAYSSIPQECLNQYLSKSFRKNLTSSITKYDSIIQDDYDSKFVIYHDVIQTQAINQIKRYMLEDKAIGWHCAKPQKRKCCNECSNSGGNYMDPICFHLDCSGSNQGSSTKCSDGEDKVVPCPDHVGDFPGAYKWVLDDSGKFYTNLADKYGIPKDWIELTDYDVYYNYGCVWNQHDENGKDVAQCRKDTDVFWRNYPKLKDNFNLTDPSDIIKNAYDKTKALLAENEVQMTKAEFRFASWGDIANTLVLPAMSMSAAVQNMEGIVKIANEKIEQDRKQGIAAIVTAIFFFVPFIGEGLGAIGLATLRTIIDLAGTFADIGYSIYDTLKDPKNALSNILGIIFAAGPLKGAFRAASAEWRALRQEKIENLPHTFLKDVTAMRKMQASCKL